MLRFWIKESVFSVVRLFISPFIRYELEFEEGTTEKILGEDQVFYALPENSISELVALDKCTRKLKKVSPIGKKKNSNLQNFVCLIRPVFDPVEQKIKRPLPQNLPEIINLKSKNIMLLPVSFYWGMHPDKQRSLFKIIFSQSWAASGPLKKFFRVLLHGRSLVIKFNTPLYLNELEDKKRTTEENSRLLNRYLRALFRKTKQAAIGPDISHRRTLVRSLSNDKEVRQEIEIQSKDNIKKKRKLKRQAYRYANEICSDINYPIVRLLQRGLNWFWNARYEGININNLEKIKSIADKNSLVYVPCHRSHIDYLALSYILLEKGLMLPHIAAGNNLNIPVFSKIGRGGGAFFMRRSFVDNKLYSTVFFQYVRRLMQRGSSIEFFPEGGRSRSGFSLPARPGLLSITLRSFASLNIDNVKIIPTYIGYEKIIEGNTYRAELLGEVKKRENFLDVFKSVRDFSNFLGNAYINFGEPIDLKDFLDKELKGEDFHIASPLERPHWLRKTTNSLGQAVMKRINSSAAITSTSLFALSLLTSTTQSLDLDTIQSRITIFLDLLKKNPLFKEVWITVENPKDITSKIESLGLVRPELLGGLKIYKPSKDEAALLSFYQNNISHFFLIYSLICLSLKYIEEISIQEISRLAKQIYPFLQNDSHLPWDINQIDQIIEMSLSVLIKSKLIYKTKSGLYRKLNEEGKNYEHYLALSRLCESTIKRVYIVMSTLWSQEKISLKDLQYNCISVANSLEKIEGWLYSEFSDPSKFKIFIDKLIEDKYLREGPDQKLSVARLTKRVQADFQQFFNPEFMKVVNQLNVTE